MVRSCALANETKAVLGGFFINGKTVFHDRQCKDDGGLSGIAPRVGDLPQPGATLFGESVTFAFKILSQGIHLGAAHATAHEIEHDMPAVSLVFVDDTIHIRRVLLNQNQYLGNFLEAMS